MIVKINQCGFVIKGHIKWQIWQNNIMANNIIPAER